MTEATSLWTLFAASFLAATLLPGGSEALLYVVLDAQTARYWTALAIATAGNTLGGMTSYLLGRMLPAANADRFAGRTAARALDYARRFGSPALAAAWVPLLGDPLCVAAGWLRLRWPPVLVFMALGKLARYWFVAELAR